MIIVISYSIFIRFFGSRYDTIDNLLGDDSDLSPSSPAVIQLTKLATSIAQVLLNASGPTFRDSNALPTPVADEETVSVLLECFLVQTNCSLLRQVLSPDWVEILGKPTLSQ